jgi:hypothetical protein
VVAACGLVDTTGFEVIAALTALPATAGIFVTGVVRVVLELAVRTGAATISAPDAVVSTLLWSGGDLAAEATVGRDKRSRNAGVCGDDLLPDADAAAFGVLFIEPDPRVEELTDAAPDGGGVGCDNRSTNDGTGVGDVFRICGDVLPSETGGFASLEADALVGRDKRSKEAVESGVFFLELDARDSGVAAADARDKGVAATDTRGDGVAAVDARGEGVLAAVPFGARAAFQRANRLAAGACLGSSTEVLLLLLVGAWTGTGVGKTTGEGGVVSAMWGAGAGATGSGGDGTGTLNVTDSGSGGAGISAGGDGGNCTSISSTLSSFTSPRW